MKRPLHIACIQTRPVETMDAAIGGVLPMMEEAAGAGAEMIFLPEYCGGLASDGTRIMPPSAPEAGHPVLEAVRAFAAERRVWVNIGSIAVDGPGDKYLNRGYMVSDAGEVAGHYDKIHLFDVDLTDKMVYRESETVEPGDRCCVHDTPFGAIGHAICYDLRFPGLFRDMAAAGAEILCCPAAFARLTGEAHWHVLNRARAIENTRYVVSACAVGGVPGGGECYGHSLVVSPWGEVVADGGDRPGVVHAKIDLGDVGVAEARVSSLRHGREYSTGQRMAGRRP